MRYSSELEVHLNLLAKNFESLRDLAPSNEIIFMVKANAYGHGINELTFFANKELSVSRFGCASLAEAINIRKNNPELDCELWVFSDLNFYQEKYLQLYSDYNIVPVIASLSQLKIFLSSSLVNFIPLVLKIDTGMNRLGIGCDNIEQMLNLLKSHNIKNIKHLMTHFASSYIKLKDGDKTHRQYDLFNQTLKEIRGAGLFVEETSCANSGAIEQQFSLEQSHIRPGLMLYGPSSMIGKNTSWQGKLISKLKTEVISIDEVRKGMPIGYGGHVCHADGHIVNLPLGYGDGILTSYSGLKFSYQGEVAQIMGRVNMDLVSIFFEKLPPGLTIGDDFYIWGEDYLSVSDLACRVKAIPYQIFTTISARVPRRYLS